MSYRAACIPDTRINRAFKLVTGACLRRGLWLGLVLSLAGAACATAQVGPGRRGLALQQQRMGGPMAPDPAFQRQRIQELNIERQKEMVAQTEELVKLTAQLNSEIGASHAKELTRGQLRMVAKIEKLAKSVREKMSNPVEGTIFNRGLTVPMFPPPGMY